jgi:hypothetical protein
MAVNPPIRRVWSEREASPLDTARRAFTWLVTGPNPVSVDGRLFPGLPHRRLPLNEVRERLLGRGCGQGTRDAVWAHLVLRSRTEGATWTLGCVGVALPALTRIAATLTARFAADPSDIHAGVLMGFVSELGRIDLRKPRVMLRLRWAAYRGGHTALREALDAPVPAGHRCRSSEPTPAWGHPDFVLARAIAENVITASDAELIASTRLEDHPLAEAAQQRGLSYGAAAQARRRAEHRLAAYLSADARGESSAEDGDRDLEVHALDSVIIATAAQRSTDPHQHSLPVATRGQRWPRKSQARVLNDPPHTGVQGCGRTPTTTARTTSATGPLAPSSPTPEVPRCA